MKEDTKDAVLRKSKTILTACFIFMFLFTGTVRAIDLSAQTVTASFKNVTLNDVIWELQKQTDFTFIYSTNDVQEIKVEDVTAVQEEVTEILDKCLENSGLTYTVHNGVVAIKKAEAPAVQVVAPQQKVKVSGQVVDTTGEPMPGVNVLVKGTTLGAITDIDGNFSIDLDQGQKATLQISFVGFTTREIAATSGRAMRVVLSEDSQLMDEIVVVGYGTQKKENLTGAVSSVDMKKTVDSRPIADIGRALQGAVPGLTVSTRSGEIGSAPTIKIRGGVGSPNGDSNPLILVDNVEVTDLTLINPDDIESISVLKDAASSSIYGARAAFGVVLITTKAKQQQNRQSISYSNNFAWRKPTRVPEQLPGWQQGQINLEGVQNANPLATSYAVVANITVDQHAIDGMKAWADKYGNGKGLGLEMEYGRDFEYSADGKNLYFYRTWDWYDMYVRDWMPQQSHNFSMSGGNGKTSYSLTLGYLNQEGIMTVNPDEFERYNANLSLVNDVNKYLSVRANVLYSKTNYDKPFMFAADLYDNLYYLYRWQPMYPYGTYEGKPFRSALTEQQQAPMTRRERDYSRLSGGFTLKPIEGLSIDFDLVYSSTNHRFKKYGGKVDAYNIFTAFSNVNALANSFGNYITAAYDYVQEDRGYTEMLSNNIVATYTKRYKDHDFKVMAGSNLEKSEYRYVESKRTGLYNTGQPELNLSYGVQTVTSAHTHWAVAGFFGRLNYSYKDRYLLEINGRYDGSSRFPSGDRFAFFPSVSAGYRLSEEAFMRPLAPVLSSLKLRGSYGSIGNQDIGLDRFISVLTPTSNYAWIINGERPPAMGTPTVVSSSLTWETVKTVDVGLDARFWDNKIGVSFDWYKRTTSDILTQPITAATLGAAAPYVNTGEIETPGWELSADFRHRFENSLEITVGAQLSDYQTKVTKWSENTTIPAYGGNGTGWFSTTYYKKGMVLGDIWGLQVDRLLQESDFNSDGTLVTGIPNQAQVFPSGYKLSPGDVLYKDLDGDGSVTRGVSTEDPKDVAIIGNMMPRYEFGLNLGAEYKGFDFNMFFQGVAKRNIWAMGNQVLPGYTAGEPYYKGAEDYWRPDNTNAFYPRPMNYSQSATGNYQVNDRYLLDMAYVRCKTLTLGYTLPKEWIDKVLIKNCRVYFTAENLFEFDNVKPDIDPEIDVRYVGTAADSRNFGRSYPYQRSLSVGLQVSF